MSHRKTCGCTCSILWYIFYDDVDRNSGYYKGRYITFLLISKEIICRGMHNFVILLCSDLSKKLEEKICVECIIWVLPN